MSGKSRIQAIESIQSKKSQLAGKITDLHFSKNSALDKKYGKEDRQKCNEDALYHLDYLVQSIQIESRELFNHYIEWAWKMLNARNIPIEDLNQNLRYINQVLSEELPAAEYEEAAPYLSDGIQYLNHVTPVIESHIKPGALFNREATEYLKLLLAGKRHQAKEFIDELVNRGVSVKDIYEHIFQASQYEVGLLWQQNKITVAHEHYCTAATQLIMSGLYPIIFSGPKKGMKLVACSVSSELHEIGIRMVSDFFEMDGWDTYYMGSNMPDSHLLSTIREYEPQLIAISVTLPVHIQHVEQLIRKIRSSPDLQELKIMAGGYPFNVIPGLDSKIGADASATSAKQAIYIANKILAT